ncbi:MAG TPA: hypothetical protein DCX89_02560 [Saprospirales bacterium]|nr:hypothetical protein [Saprospirales bacterium]
MKRFLRKKWPAFNVGLMKSPDFGIIFQRPGKTYFLKIMFCFGRPGIKKGGTAEIRGTTLMKFFDFNE